MERVKLANTLDSLFLKNELIRIIQTCSIRSHESDPACVYNLIAAYYFLGDSAKSRELLDKEVCRIKAYPDFDAYSLDLVLNTEYASYKKFLFSSTTKDYIVNVIDSAYYDENVSDKKNGLELLHLLIEDQWVRNMSSLYDKLRPERKYPLPSPIDSIKAIQAQRDHSTKVFSFYKNQNRVFSKAEVGRIYYWQMMLFFHELDMERREFYHKLVEQGVKDGALKVEDQMNFEIGTKYIKMGIEAFF